GGGGGRAAPGWRGGSGCASAAGGRGGRAGRGGRGGVPPRGGRRRRPPGRLSARTAGWRADRGWTASGAPIPSASGLTPLTRPRPRGRPLPARSRQRMAASSAGCSKGTGSGTGHTPERVTSSDQMRLTPTGREACPPGCVRNGEKQMSGSPYDSAAPQEEAHIHQARRFLQQKQPQEAIQVVRRHLSFAPGTSTDYLLLGVALAEAGEG